MCRGNDDYNHGVPYGPHHHHLSHRLKLHNFAVNLSLSSKSSVYLQELLTLVFLPRVNGGRLDVNGSKIRQDSPAFLTLHRNLSPLSSDVAYACKDRAVVSDGAAFEVHVGEVRLLKGVFREDDCEFDWRMECRSTAEERDFPGVKAVEVGVCAAEGAVMREKVVVEKLLRRKKKGFKMGLKEIPEERECDVEERESNVEDEPEEEEEEGGSDGGDSVELMEMESEIEGVRWAVDVGIWVACLGLGLLVTRASARSVWRRKLLL